MSGTQTIIFHQQTPTLFSFKNTDYCCPIYTKKNLFSHELNMKMNKVYSVNKLGLLIQRDKIFVGEIIQQNLYGGKFCSF